MGHLTDINGRTHYWYTCTECGNVRALDEKAHGGKLDDECLIEGCESTEHVRVTEAGSFL